MKTYSDYLRSVFGPGKVQKISVNAGMSCPNRDGSIGTGGCIYCDNSSFTPSYCMTIKEAAAGTVTAQLEAGKAFFSRKYPEMRWLAYFQSFSNTYGRPVDELRRLYEAAASVDGVVGIVIGTRPDTLPDEVVGMLAELNRRLPVIVEIGAESSFDKTLRLVNRGHTWHDVTDAVCRLHSAGIRSGLHLIAGLPGETDGMVLENVRRACELPIDTLKLHQLQILKGTPLHRLWLAGETEVEPYTLDRYLDLCRRVIDIVPERIVVERFLAQSPPAMVAAPKWGLKNHEFADRLRNLCEGRKPKGAQHR